MAKVKPRLLAVALGALMTLATPVLAESFDFTTTDGPLHLHIDHNGEVRGHYDQRGGTMFGHVVADGVVQGIWLQPRSDHPCSEMRHNTYAWGAFAFTDLDSDEPRGFWGYCGEQPRRDWQLQRD